MTNAYSPRIVLASASPRRRELLAALGLPFDVVPSDADETVDALTAGGGATHVAEVLALRKARAVADVHPGARVIGSDTVVVLDGRLLGKPVDAGDARAMLLALRGRAHEVVTGVAVLSEGRELVAHERTVVTMRPYSEQEIEAFIASGSPFDKAGGYAIQDEAFAPVGHFEGCRCNVIGLPLSLLAILLHASGVDVDTPAVDCAVCNPLDVTR